MNIDELDQFILEKESRYLILQERKKKLKSYNVDIKVSKIKRFFGSGFSYLKRLFNYLFGFALIILSIAILVFPKFVTKDIQISEVPIKQYKETFFDLSGMKLNECLTNLNTIEAGIESDKLMYFLDKAVNSNSLDENLYFFRMVAVFILCIGLLLIYIAWSSKKGTEGQSKLSDFQALTQQIITDYKFTIDEEIEELKILKKIQEGIHKKE